MSKTTQGTAIEWTDFTYNPTVGCTHVSAGCNNCYADAMAKRLQAMGQADYKDGFAPRIHERRLDPKFSKHPWRIKEPSKIFVNSMSDLFHADFPLSFIQRVLDLFSHPRGAHHTYQILTKRSKRLAELAPQINWPANVWMGVSVEDASKAIRIDRLRTVSTSVRFLSLEPLLGPLPQLNLDCIHWVIVGGESGPGARPMSLDWVRDIRDQCVRYGVPYFFKQVGGVNKKATGRLLDGRTWDEMPARAEVARA